MDQNNVILMFDLIRSSVCDCPISEEQKKSVKDEIINEVIKLSSKHYVHSLVFDGLYKNGMIDSEHKYYSKLQQMQVMLICNHEKREHTYVTLCKVLEDAKIDFMPLKGSVIRSGYKEGWMRFSCDIDILIKEEDVQRASDLLVKECGYTYEGKNSHDHSFYSPERTHLELHYNLNLDMVSKESGAVMKRVWTTAVRKEGYNHWYLMPDEMFYFYHMLHMAKHFLTGGCGIKPFVDLLILEKMAENDDDIARKRDDLLKEGRLILFAQSVRELYRVWFFGEEHNETTSMMQEYVFTGGVYGTGANKVMLNRQRAGGRIKYALSRLFMPYEALKYRYPNLENRRYLMPFYTVRRWFEVFTKDRFRRISNEVDISNNVSSEDQKGLNRLLSDLGL